MREVQIGTPCRGAYRAAKRRLEREAAERWSAAHRESTPARMKKVWRLEEERLYLVHRLFWRQIARCRWQTAAAGR